MNLDWLAEAGRNGLELFLNTDIAQMTENWKKQLLSLSIFLNM